MGKPLFKQYSTNIICPACGALGVVVWENDSGGRSLVSLSHGFYERISDKEPYLIELVCHDCGAAQPEE